jgi:hypothetical protein
MKAAIIKEDLIIKRITEMKAKHSKRIINASPTMLMMNLN